MRTLILLLLPLVTFAQTSATATLSGTVFDPTGAVVPNATARVQLATATPDTATTVLTDQVGHFTFPNLVPGTYTLEVLQKGFKLFPRKLLALQPGQTLQADARLELGEIAITETITAPRTPVPAPTKPAGTPQRIRVGGMVQPAKVIKKVNPTYPQSAKAAGIEGLVQMEAVIGKDGFIRSAILAPGNSAPDLATAALDALRQWQYEPTLLNGEPVEVLARIDMRFQLQ